MALPSSGTSSTTLCNHCERNVPASNFDLHHAHCIRNLERCTVCGDMIPKSRAKEHYQDTHAPVACSKCGDSIERELLLIHERDKCLQRIVVCGYCDFPLPAVELNTHLEICGNRTELCHPCGKYVRLCEKLAHDLQFHEENSEASGVSSRLFLHGFSHSVLIDFCFESWLHGKYLSSLNQRFPHQYLLLVSFVF
ncbi:uncharacterized protein LOC131032764 isoform X2 [Cryptomeria japonica]|uniref:uncharacterized protein LOC131032764 isoform X2 n=1 Tax=Cryptomeria japonica TaxID=3369 RepID=UPI0027D9F1BC|nr:uncharacterized protein LOC131032764 isoform X2 [Cryptomeria japonica]